MLALSTNVCIEDFVEGEINFLTPTDLAFRIISCIGGKEMIV